MKYVIPFLVVLAGAGTAAMIPMTTRLKETLLSPLLAVALTSAIGILCLLLLAAMGVLGKSDLSRVGQVPWWAWLGGILGGTATVIFVLAKDQGGATALIAAGSIFGQLTMAMVIDNYGWLDAQKQPINAWKIAGAILLCAGALMMGKK